MSTRGINTREWHLRPEVPILECGLGAVQFGLDRRWAIRMDDLSEKEIRWLQAGAKKQSRLRRSAKTHGVGESRAIQICGLLARSGFLVPPGTNTPSAQAMLGVTRRVASGGPTDLPALSALRPDGQGQATLDRRALSSVEITTSGRLGAQVALLLAAAGVGTLHLPDSAPVTAADVGPYPVAAVGRARAGAMRRRFIELGLTPRLALDGAPDLTISIETGTQGAAYFGTLHQLVVPHLAVAIGEAEVEIGPFVLPSRSACTHCLQLTRAAADAQWSQLLAEICALPPRPIETVLAGAAAAYIVAQALTFLDGGTPSLVNGLATIALPEVTPQVVPLYPNPNCGCVTVPPPADYLLAENFSQGGI